MPLKARIAAWRVRASERLFDAWAGYQQGRGPPRAPPARITIYSDGGAMSDFTDQVLAQLASRAGGATAADLAKYVKGDKGAVVRALRSLKEQGLVNDSILDVDGDVVYSVTNPHTTP